MTQPASQSDIQYIWCAVCLEINRELEAAGKTPQLAITIIDGTAACEEHRRRVDGYAQAVRAARRFHGRDNDISRRA